MVKWRKIEGTKYEFWKPVIGDEIEGNVIDIKEGSFGKQHVLESKGHEQDVMLPAHKQLQGLLSEVEIGALVKVKLLKKELPKVKGDNPLKIYEVFVGA